MKRSRFKKKKSGLNQSKNSKISVISNNRRTSKVNFETEQLNITQENKNLLGSLVQNEDGKSILQDPKKNSTVLKEEKVINSKKIENEEIKLNINNLDDDKLNINVKNTDEKLDMSNFDRQPIDMDALANNLAFKKNEPFDIAKFIEKSSREIDNVDTDFEKIDNVEDLKNILRKNQFTVKDLKEENEELKKEKREIQKNLDMLRNQVNELKLEKRIFQKRTMEFATLDRNIIEQQLKNLEESNPKEDKFLIEIAEENKKLAKRSLEKTARMQKMKDDIEGLRQTLEKMSF